MKVLLRFIIALNLVVVTTTSATPLCNDLLDREQHYIQALQSKGSNNTVVLACPQSKSFTKTVVITQRSQGAPKEDVINTLNAIPVCATKDENSDYANEVNIICGKCPDDQTKTCRPLFKRTACKEIEKGKVDPFASCILASLEGEPIRYMCTRTDKASITFTATCKDDVCDKGICQSSNSESTGY